MKKHLLIIVIISLIYQSGFGQTQLINNGNFSSCNGWELWGDFACGNTYSNCPCDPPPCYGYGYLSGPNGSPGYNLFGGITQSVTLPYTCSSATFTFYFNATSD